MSTDLRIFKTKRALKQSLEELLSKEPFEKITISKICDKAYVNRVTFYSHYQDKYDLLQDYLEDIKEEIILKTKEKLTKNLGLLEGIEDFCIKLTETLIDYLQNNKALLKALSYQEDSVPIYMIERLTIEELNQLIESFDEIYPIVMDKSYAVSFILGGSVKMIHDWISRGGSDEEAAHFKEVAKELIEKTISLFK